MLEESPENNRPSLEEEVPVSGETSDVDEPEMPAPEEAAAASNCPTCQQAPQLVYALGNLGIDLVSEARLVSLGQGMPANTSPDNPADLLNYIKDNPFVFEAINWTLNIENTPIYAIRPMGCYAHFAYDMLYKFITEQMESLVQCVSIPGYTHGQTALMSGLVVPNLVPVVRGMYSWNTAALVNDLCGDPPEEGADQEEFSKKRSGIYNFLERVYHELRNPGMLAQERALNYAASNAYQVARVFEYAITEGLELDTIQVDKTPISRPSSDCWDVILVFFHPKHRQDVSRKAYRFTVDVSDVIPAMVGPLRQWFVY